MDKKTKNQKILPYSDPDYPEEVEVAEVLKNVIKIESFYSTRKIKLVETSSAIN